MDESTDDVLKDFVSYIKGEKIAPGVKPKKNPLTKQPGCYVLTHTKSGKRYVGSTVNLAGRIAGNISHLKMGTHKNGKLQELYNSDSEIIAVLKTTSTEIEARNLEQEVVNKLLSTGELCNIATKDVTKTMLGVKRTPEFVEQIRQINRDRKVTDATRQKMSEAHLGKPLSNELKQKLSSRWKEFYSTDEGKLSKAASIAKLKKAVSINGVTYDSRADASRILGIPVSTLINRCKSSSYPEWLLLDEDHLDG